MIHKHTKFNLFFEEDGSGVGNFQGSRSNRTTEEIRKLREQILRGQKLKPTTDSSIITPNFIVKELGDYFDRNFTLNFAIEKIFTDGLKKLEGITDEKQNSEENQKLNELLGSTQNLAYFIQQLFNPRGPEGVGFLRTFVDKLWKTILENKPEIEERLKSGQTLVAIYSELCPSWIVQTLQTWRIDSFFSFVSRFIYNYLDNQVFRDQFLKEYDYLAKQYQKEEKEKESKKDEQPKRQNFNRSSDSGQVSVNEETQNQSEESSSTNETQTGASTPDNANNPLTSGNTGKSNAGKPQSIQDESEAKANDKIETVQNQLDEKRNRVEGENDEVRARGEARADGIRDEAKNTQGLLVDNTGMRLKQNLAGSSAGGALVGAGGINTAGNLGQSDQERARKEAESKTINQEFADLHGTDEEFLAKYGYDKNGNKKRTPEDIARDTEKLFEKRRYTFINGQRIVLPARGKEYGLIPENNLDNEDLDFISRKMKGFKEPLVGKSPLDFSESKKPAGQIRKSFNLAQKNLDDSKTAKTPEQKNFFLAQAEKYASRANKRAEIFNKATELRKTAETMKKLRMLWPIISGAMIPIFLIFVVVGFVVILHQVYCKPVENIRNTIEIALGVASPVATVGATAVGTALDVSKGKGPELALKSPLRVALEQSGSCDAANECKPNGATTGSTNVTASSGDQYVAAVLSILESPTLQGRLDVAQVIANRTANNFNSNGNTVRDQAFASGQFQPFFTSIGKDDIQDKASAIRALQAKGYSETQATTALNEFLAATQDSAKVQESASKIGVFMYFKGTSEYKNMKGGEFLRSQGENFFYQESYDKNNYTQGNLSSLFNGVKVGSIINPTQTLAKDTSQISPFNLIGKIFSGVDAEAVSISATTISNLKSLESSGKIVYDDPQESASNQASAGKLQESTVQEIIALANAYQVVNITSLNDSGHAANGSHYAGLGIDIGYVKINGKEYAPKDVWDGANDQIPTLVNVAGQIASTNAINLLITHSKLALEILKNPIFQQVNGESEAGTLPAGKVGLMIDDGNPSTGNPGHTNHYHLSVKPSATVNPVGTTNASAGCANDPCKANNGTGVIAGLAVDCALKALLETVSGAESGGKYNVIFGGETFDLTAQPWHPDKCVNITSGRNAGKCSTAAGKYQMITTTWCEWAGKAGVPIAKGKEGQKYPTFDCVYYDFSPQYQELAVAKFLERGGLGDAAKAAKTLEAFDGILRSPLIASQWTSTPYSTVPEEITTTPEGLWATFQAKRSQYCNTNTSKLPQQETINSSNILALLGGVKVEAAAGVRPSKYADISNKHRALLSVIAAKYGDALYSEPSGSELQSVDGVQVNYTIVAKLNEMKQAAYAQGVSLTVVSGFRSYDDQVGTFFNPSPNVTNPIPDSAIFDETSDLGSIPYQNTSNAYTLRAQKSAVPGYSEHHTGLAIDLNSVETSYWQSVTGQNTYNWLKQNASKYGFTQSYPESSGDRLEQWHYRYDGTSGAKEIYKYKVNNPNANNGNTTIKCNPNAVTVTNGSSKFTGTFNNPAPAAVLTSPYGERWGKLHAGIDLAAPIGTPVLASAGGKVTYASYDQGGYGNFLIITHEDPYDENKGYTTRYGHLNSFSVKEGDLVAQGQLVGEMGSTGFSTGPHTHFEIRLNGTPIDPCTKLTSGCS